MKSTNVSIIDMDVAETVVQPTISCDGDEISHWECFFNNFTVFERLQVFSKNVTDMMRCDGSSLSLCWTW